MVQVKWLLFVHQLMVTLERMMELLGCFEIISIILSLILNDTSMDLKGFYPKLRGDIVSD